MLTFDTHVFSLHLLLIFMQLFTIDLTEENIDESCVQKIQIDISSFDNK